MKATLLIICYILFTGTACTHKAFTPGDIWYDTDGIPINAHGGGVIYVGDTYYWYGEHKLPGLSEEQKADGGVSCYSSKNLYDWTNEGLALSVDYADPDSDIAYGCILERPKVLYNKATGKYVMFFKLYIKGTGYETGYVGVATGDFPNGDFTYSHKFLGADSEKGSGDFCMFPDNDGQVYHYTVRKPDKAFCAGPLSEDYLRPLGGYQVLEGITLHTEAPTVTYNGGNYYLTGSGSSGWEPNTARSFVADSPLGPFSELGNPCKGSNPHNGMDHDKTFGGQISYMLSVHGSDAYIAMFDIWEPERPIKGRYVWLPAYFENGKVTIEWHDKWDLSVFRKRNRTGHN